MDSGMFKLVLYKRYFFTLSGCGAVIKGYYLIRKNLQKNNRRAQNNRGKHIVSYKSFPTRILGENLHPGYDHYSDVGTSFPEPAAGMPAGSGGIDTRSPITRWLKKGIP